MKNLVLTLCVVTYSATMLYAEKYESAMGAAIQQLYAANNLEEYVEVASLFERIGTAEKSEWLPYYYASLGYVWASHQVNDPLAIDKQLDKAQQLIDQASILSSDNDEIITVQGYIYMMKVVVDPASRGPEYSGLAMQQFGRATGMNPSNPRALLLLGRMQMGTDQFFDNDLSQSCGMISKAASMFEEQVLQTSIHPSWGKEMAQMFVAECSNN